MLSNSLNEIRMRSATLSEAYRLRLLATYWANLIFMVLPAVFATGAAVCAAGKVSELTTLAAWLAGAAAVLTTVHKTLKCDEYQSECLRLSQRYRKIATLADSALMAEGGPDPKLPSPQTIILEFAELEESAKALLSDRYIHRAEEAIRKAEARKHEKAPGAGLDLNQNARWDLANDNNTGNSPRPVPEVSEKWRSGKIAT
jgi:hypothetical protein